MSEAAKAILGIDAAWTVEQPSGVALIESTGQRWRVVRAAPSYDGFLEHDDSVVWRTPKHRGSPPDLKALLESAKRMLKAPVVLVAVDMPLARSPITARRPSDSAISRRFGKHGCSTHSPSAKRPGPIERAWMSQLAAAGFPLATTAAGSQGVPCSIEVYPHPALLELLERDFRFPYKVSKSRRLWPDTTVEKRKASLIASFETLDRALREELGPTGIRLPKVAEVPTLTYLKRFEDVLDALVCAWIGTRFLEGKATGFGDEDSTIWVPIESRPDRSRP